MPRSILPYFGLILGPSLAALLSGCGTPPRQQQETSRAERTSTVTDAQPKRSPSAVQPPKPTSRTARGGGYYLDDGPGDSPPPDLDSVSEPTPQLEPLHRAAMRPYVVLGQTFTPMTELLPYKARGVASWYGRRYHGKQTSNGEIYDMYGISAAHPTLPLPSYARVTHAATGKSIVVRINDRGPFLDGRLIDLSYTAAVRLGVIGGGSALVEVETIIPEAAVSGTIYATAPASQGRTAAAQSGTAASASRSTSSATHPYDGQVDPILAIAAAAARDAQGTAPPSSGIPAATPTATATAHASAVTEGSTVYLQLGAFGSRENAVGYLERARVQFEWLAERLQVRTREGLFRVQAGPYASSHEAKQAADRIAATLGAKPVLFTR